MNALQPEILFVAWQDVVRRSILPVARLVKRSGTRGSFYEFAYIQGAQRAAAEHGFLPFLSFPRFDQLYRSAELLPFFRNRLMPPSRPDYVRYLAELGLERSANPMTVLARSSGFRNTDTIELFAPPELRADNKLEAHFLLRGVRHVPYAEERIERLRSSESLYFLRDVQNSWNRQAIAVTTEDKQMLGYVPDYLCGDLADILENDRQAPDVQISVVKVNPAPAPTHHRLLCRLVATVPEGFQPFQDDQFRPISRAAFETSQAA